MAKAAAQKTTPIASGTGRRKSSVARVWLRKGSGKITVNEKDFSSYFDTDVARKAARKPFDVIADKAKQFDVIANVVGGGVRGQADAVQLGISRALLDFDEQLKSLLKSHDLLTVDSRVKERKKYGQRGARRKFQFVKR